MTPTKTIIYLLSVLIVAYCLYFSLPAPQAFWLVTSAFIFSLVTLGETFSHQLTLLAIAVLLSAFAALISGVCASSIYLLAIYLFLITGAVIYFVERYPDYAILGFVIPVFAILGAKGAPTYLPQVNKFRLILGGGLIVMAAQLIFVYQFKMNEVRNTLAVALNHLQKLTSDIFSCFHADYANKTYLFEQRIHSQKNKFMHAISKVKALDLDAATLEGIYILLLDCAHLRNRITDLTIFSLCQKEIEELSQSLNQAYLQLKAAISDKKATFSTESLSQKIVNFDDIYHSVLQVTATEPSVFVFFIASLKKLVDEMQKFYDGLQIQDEALDMA